MTKIVMAIGKKLLNKNTPATQKKCVSQTCYSFLQRFLADEEYADKPCRKRRGEGGEHYYHRIHKEFESQYHR